MIRPAVIAVSLLGVVTAGTVTTLTHTTHATATTVRADQQVCVVLAKDPAHQHTEYYCIDVGSLLK